MVIESGVLTGDHFLVAFRERAKELSCLYTVEELFERPGISLPGIIRGIVEAIPGGWKYPEVCRASVNYGGVLYHQPDFIETPWAMHSTIVSHGNVVGKVSVYYVRERPAADEGPFLKEERRLIDAIADRLGRRVLYEKLKDVFDGHPSGPGSGPQWRSILDLLQQTDVSLFMRMSRKMLTLLSSTGDEEAGDLLARYHLMFAGAQELLSPDSNAPLRMRQETISAEITDEIFRMAEKHYGNAGILGRIQKWVMEDRSAILVKILEDPWSSIEAIDKAVDRYLGVTPAAGEEVTPKERGYRVSLIRRLLTEDMFFISIARKFLDISDFRGLLQKVIYPTESHGKLGGKSAGLFLASEILKKTRLPKGELPEIKIPKTWYLTSDGILRFIQHNDLEEIVEQKYEDITRIRQEYPYLVHLFKNSTMPPEIVNGLSVALDDFGDSPLIVRSSSLLEDRFGTSFAGKYKSLFIANQGPKRERLNALVDAIAEVYASTFSPDPIEYRIEHGMIDFHEEMGIMIQEVVGKRVGDYYFPALAGVAFTNNEYRWARRLKREDGLLRLVTGLGTRAVDRLSDEYPIMISPGQPNLRANVTIDEKVYYSPRNADVINLKTNAFETVPVKELLRRCGEDYPMLQGVVSRLRNERIEPAGPMGFDFENDRLVVTFDGLIKSTPFVANMRAILKTLQAEMGTPVDVEFAHDGTSLFLVQCRAQAYGMASQPAAIPRDVEPEKIVFSASRHVTNGVVTDITHVVYVDPLQYSAVGNLDDLLAVGQAVSALNQVLPKHRFILLGPGRWGSRGDIKLGVNVSYSDIKNTAMLIEIARKQGGYMPEPSFGTHFFQDLVESSIKYLPLYPDDRGAVFNEAFFLESENFFASLVPKYARLAGVIRVIDVPHSYGGQVLKVLMDGERDEALAILTVPSSVQTVESALGPRREIGGSQEDDHWSWRTRFAEWIAAELEPERFNVKAVYLIGGVKNASAGPQSDIDLLVHFGGTKEQERELMSWFEGWSLALSQVNFLRTGYRTRGLLDIHLVTDKDIANKTGYASKIGASTDPPRPLTPGKRPPQ
jgi:pyruvate,water dikinase